ncbi:RNA polymerase sigma factor [Engelhardtia mirabilis]|uniref:RNA polymerase sigma factor n=1 Tax=Engelhardtia mirabilis TaxID=2528011 RepID=A0A518BFH5_9BACT|nr:RNA polymerase sigma factor [Planctomycetes bacterium Pla133]QDV00048.1 RNA polymerase sigma factor [Planctomycetes bacterium Pla86]
MATTPIYDQRAGRPRKAPPQGPPEVAQDDWSDPALSRLARGVLGGDTAEDDLAQEAWLIARRRGIPGRAFRSGVIRRLASRWRRSEQRRARREARAATPLGWLEPSAPLEQDELAAILASALDGLEPDQALAVRLRFLEQLDVTAIAARTGVREDTVRWRIRRGLERLRDVLERRHGGWYRLALAMLAGVALPRPERVAAPQALLAGTTGATLKVTGGVAVLCLLLVGLVATIVLRDPSAPGDSAVPAAALPSMAEPNSTQLAAVEVPAQAPDDGPDETLVIEELVGVPPPPVASAALVTLPGIAPARLHGTVHGPGGPVADALVVARMRTRFVGAQSELELGSISTDAQGRFDLGLAIGGAGPVNLTVAALGHLTQTLSCPLSLADPDPDGLEVVMTHGSSISGVLVHPSGEPMSGVRVAAAAERMEGDVVSMTTWAANYADSIRANLTSGALEQWTVTDEFGYFELRGLSERSWFIQSRDPRWRLTTAQSVAAGTRDLVLETERRHIMCLFGSLAPIGSELATTIAPIEVVFGSGRRATYDVADRLSATEHPLLRSFGQYIDVDLGDPEFEDVRNSGSVRTIRAAGMGWAEATVGGRWDGIWKGHSWIDGSPLVPVDWGARKADDKLTSAVQIRIVDDIGRPVEDEVLLLVSTGFGDKPSFSKEKVSSGYLTLTLRPGLRQLMIHEWSVRGGWPLSASVRWIESEDPDPPPFVLGRPASLEIDRPADATGEWWLELLAPGADGTPALVVRHVVTARRAVVPFLPHGDWTIRRGGGKVAVEERVAILPAQRAKVE